MRAKSINDRREPVDLVDDDAIDLPYLDISHQALESRPVSVAAREANVVVDRQHDPTVVLLAGDVGLGRLPLGVEGVEVLLEALVGGFAGVHGTADG